jgi:hypothetical protein
VGENGVSNFAKMTRFLRHLGIFYMLQIYDMGPTALFPLRRKACSGIFRSKNPTALAGFEPANLGTRGQHANHQTIEAANPELYTLKQYVCCIHHVTTQNQTPKDKNGHPPVLVLSILCG